jgi:putative tricarboxylic transport membrane protein
MDSAILLAFQLAFSMDTLIAVAAGTLFGTIVGAMPGLGTMLAIAICLPFTFTMSNTAAIGLLLSVYGSSIYGGSISAVLLNSPGTPQSAATGLDGYQMARMGYAEKALGWVTISSVFGAIISCVILVMLAPKLAQVSVKYGTPLMISALIIMGIACISTLSVGNQVKGLMMGVLGLFWATVGTDPVSGELRFIFGLDFLASGIAMLPVCVGLYPLAEVFYRIYERQNKMASEALNCNKIAFPKLREWKNRVFTLVSSSLIGTFVGILPGAGATPATFMSYSFAKRFSKFGKNFTKGEPSGLISAESANNATTGGALIPTLALGIPGDATTALMLFTFTIHGISPGPRLMVNHPEVLFSVYMTLIVANLLIVPAAILTVRFFGKMIKVPEPLLFGMIILFSLLGAYIGRGNMADIPIALAIGVFAFACRLGDFPVTPLLIGYVLGPELEFNLGQVLIYKQRAGWGEYLLNQPVALALLIIALILVIAPIISGVLRFFKKPKLKET